MASQTVGCRQCSSGSTSTVAATPAAALAAAPRGRGAARNRQKGGGGSTRRRGRCGGGAGHSCFAAAFGGVTEKVYSLLKRSCFPLITTFCLARSSGASIHTVMPHARKRYGVAGMADEREQHSQVLNQTAADPVPSSLVSGLIHSSHSHTYTHTARTHADGNSERTRALIDCRNGNDLFHRSIQQRCQNGWKFAAACCSCCMCCCCMSGEGGMSSRGASCGSGKRCMYPPPKLLSLLRG